MSNTSIKFTDLPTWAEAGPEVLREAPLQNDFEPKYEVNSAINQKVTFWFGGDSSKLECDAVVNAANSYLEPGGGICGILHDAAGPQMAADCELIGYTETGKAAITQGYNLPAKYVIHAVGPIGENPEALQSAYQSTLNYIDGRKIKSIGFCCISTGIYGYPIVPATHVALETCRRFLEDPENLNKTDRLIFVIFERRDCQVYKELAHLYFPLEGVYYSSPNNGINNQNN